jgi:hypothetical protein
MQAQAFCARGSNPTLSAVYGEELRACPPEATKQPNG